MKLFPLNATFSLKEIPPPKLSDLQEKAIEAYWEGRENRELFNGRLFQLIRFSSDELVGYFIPYKWYYAATCDQTLEKELSIKPLGVTGVTLLNGEVLIGKRGEWVFQERGVWECVPSGTVDEIDLKEKLLKELEEETAISRDYVEGMDQFSLLEHERGVEFVARITLLGSPPLRSKEYDALKFTTDFSLLCPTSCFLLDALLLKGEN